jgi:hypothetical protein
MKETQRQYIQSMKSEAKELRRTEKMHIKLAQVYGSRALDLERKASTLEQQDAKAKARR